MFRTISLAVLAATAAIAGTSPASAGCCCTIQCPVAAPAPVMVYEPYEMPQIYVVDRGPVYSGPGIYTNPTVMRPWRMPDYPYVGHRSPAYLPPYHEPAPLRSRAQAMIPRRAVRRSQSR